MPNRNVNIRVELARNHSGKLTLMACFDKNAPNFAKDNEGYYWVPTIEEKDFLNDAFGLIPGSEAEMPSSNIEDLKKDEPMPKKEIEPIPEEKPEPKENIPNDDHKETEEIEKVEPVPIPVKEEIKSEDFPIPEKKEEDKIFEVNKNENENENRQTDNDEKSDDGKVLVKADEAAIEAALRKKEEKDKSMVEVDEQTIIDKVLSQKKKGKWGKK